MTSTTSDDEFSVFDLSTNTKPKLKPKLKSQTPSKLQQNNSKPKTSKFARISGSSLVSSSATTKKNISKSKSKTYSLSDCELSSDSDSGSEPTSSKRKKLNLESTPRGTKLYGSHTTSTIFLDDEDEDDKILGVDKSADAFVVRQSHVDAARQKLEQEKLLLKQAQQKMRKLSSSPKKQSVPLENTGVTRNSPSIENPISEHNQHALDARPIHNQVEDPISIIVRVWSKESQTTPKTKLKFQVLPSHLLKSIMDKICEREGGNPESYVFFCHSIKLLPLSTVATIKAFHNPDENVKIDVYTHEHHEEMVRVRNVEFERNMSEFADKSEDGSGTGNAGSTIVGSAAVSSQAVDADDVLTVVLRDKTGAELKMRVKKSTTVGSMINAYLKKSGVVSAKMRLEFDHETLDADATVEDCGIEDDDMIDVKY